MKQVFKIDSNGFYIEDVILNDGESTPLDCVETQPTQGLYKPQFSNGSWVEGRSQADILNDAKQLKKDTLSAQCNAVICGGFPSSALGVEHNYPSDEEAQRNFHSELDRINLDATYTTIYFKTFDSGYLPHTVDQFKQVFIDGHTYGRNQITKLNQLKADIDKVTDPKNLDDITW